MPATPHLIRRLRRAMPLAALALLAACGGGGDHHVSDPAVRPSSCTVADNKRWLSDYFRGNLVEGVRPNYFWYALSPNPDPVAFADEAAYFDALMYTGVATEFPADRWSFYQPTADFNSFFGDGQSLGYGIFVAGLETEGDTGRPLYVRYVEPLSPAALDPAVPVRRGDRIVSINGRTAADLIANDPAFSILTTDAVGTVITLVLEDALAQQRTVQVTSRVFDLSPVVGARMVSSPQGKAMGYVQVNYMISQASDRLANAFQQFSTANARELVLDLRYNGGGLVSTAAEIASYAAGSFDAGQVFSRLLYNDRKSFNNRDYLFRSQFNQLGLDRVYVLAGPRTCSASEQLVNGLRGIGINAIVVGDTTCGKPVGFLPEDNGCGTTYSVVNFESVNARNEGRYFDGFTACAVAEDFSQTLGTSTEPLLAKAMRMADGEACGTVSAQARERVQALRARGVTRPMVSDGPHPSAIPR